MECRTVAQYEVHNLRYWHNKSTYLEWLTHFTKGPLLLSCSRFYSSAMKFRTPGAEDSRVRFFLHRQFNPMLAVSQGNGTAVLTFFCRSCPEMESCAESLWAVLLQQVMIASVFDWGSGSTESIDIALMPSTLLQTLSMLLYCRSPRLGCKRLYSSTSLTFLNLQLVHEKRIIQSQIG
jgi:hypothetical protein